MTADAPHPRPERDLERLDLARAVAYGQLVAMPAALANVALAAQTPTPTGALNLTFLGLLVGFAIAGLAAGRNARRDATRHGAIAGALAFVPVQVVGLLGRLDRGDGVSVAGIIVLGLLAAGSGAVGGRLGARRRATVEARSAAPNDHLATTEGP